MSKIKNLYNQFGALYILKAFFKRLLSPLVKSSAFYILAIENHKPEALDDMITVIDAYKLSDFLKSDIKYSHSLEKKLKTFLPNDTIAVLVIKEKEVAGWGFVQRQGLSKYASYDYIIPKGANLLKNLFVEPNFRGQSIGKHINRGRINCIPKEVIPIVFVIPSNTYAIRNLEMYGFNKQLLVKDYLWFNKIHKRDIRIIGVERIAKLLITGFNNE